MDFKTVNDIFINRLFRIPDYQRGYAWRSDDDKEVVAFWNDLMNLPKDKSHFTGTLTLQEMSDAEKQKLQPNMLLRNGGYKPWLVVDGQQRLTTISILLQCVYEFLVGLSNKNQFFMGEFVGDYAEELRKKYIGKEDRQQHHMNYLLGYLNNPASENYLYREVFGDDKVLVKEESYYTLNMKAAKSFFKEHLNALYQQKGLQAVEDLYRKVTLNLSFGLIEIGQNSTFNIFVAFETMNNRGRQLSNLEKLKNRLIYLTTLYVSPTDPFINSSELPIRKQINDAWAEIYRQLGRNVSKSPNGKVLVLDDDEFLRTHWILYYQYSRRTGNDYVDFLLGKKFTVQNVLQGLASSEATQEVLRDEEVVEEEVMPVTPSNALTLLDIQNYVLDLRDAAEAWYYTWFPQDAKGKLDDEEIKWIERINRVGIAYFRPLITAICGKRLKGKISKDQCVKLLAAIERFIFIVFRLQTTRSHYGSSEFSRMAHELHDGTKSVDDVLNLLQDRSTLNTKDMQVMVEKLFEQKDDERVGFYQWSAIRYFLFEYNAYLEGKEHGQAKLSWDAFMQSERDKISIEHIFPHKAEGDWRTKFAGVDPSMWYIFEGSLGNLLILSQKINAKLQNYDFATKRDGLQSTDQSECRIGYLDGSAAEREVAKNASWTPATILSTGLKMLEFMEKRWGITLGSDDEKKSLLLPGVDPNLLQSI